jgi:hypothetical protein
MVPNIGNRSTSIVAVDKPMGGRKKESRTE